MSERNRQVSAVTMGAPRWAWALVILWALASVAGLAGYEYQNALRGVICMPRR